MVRNVDARRKTLEAKRDPRLQPPGGRAVASAPSRTASLVDRVKALRAKHASAFSRASGVVADRKPARKERATLTIATVNDDFTDRKTNARRVDADILLMQETKNTDLHHVFDAKNVGVHQNFDRKDKAGSAIAYDREKVHVEDAGYVKGVDPHGREMLTRWINYTDVKVGGAKVRMVSVHRPPARFKALWPEFDRNLAAFVKRSKLPVVIGMDANQRNPQALAKKCGLKWHAPGPGSIDGFLASPEVKFEFVKNLSKGSSDHHPVKAKISVPVP